jgi:replicative DNA helicase
MTPQPSTKPAAAILGGSAYSSTDVEALWSEDIEKAVIAAALTYPGAFEVMQPMVKSGDFFLVKYDHIWTAMNALATDGIEINVISLMDKLKKSGKVDAVGGMQTIIDLQAVVVEMQGVRTYAAGVHDYAKRRELLKAADEIKRQAYDFSSNFPAIARRADGILEKVVTAEQDKQLVPAFKGVPKVLDYVEAAMDGRAPKAIPTGLTDLDDLIGGWQRGRLHALVACTGIGKSLVTYNAALDAAKQGYKVAIWSLEILERDVLMQIIALESELHWDLFRDGRATEAQYSKFLEAAARVDQLPLFINDGVNTTPGDIERQCKLVKESVGLDAVFVDYWQMVQGVDAEHDREMTSRMKYVSRELHNIAPKYDIAMIVTAQAKPTVADRQDKRPQMYDAADSNQLSKDADIVIGLYRDGYYNPASEYASQFDFIVRKNRIRNKFGTASVYHDETCGRLKNGNVRRVSLSDDPFLHK